MRHQQRALELNPNDDLVVVQQGEILTAGGAELRVERTLGQRITKVRITLPSPAPQQQPAAP